MKQQTKGYKVTDENMQCRGFQFELGKVFTQSGKVKICETGFHFCVIANDCFNYYSFESTNRVFEIMAYGDLDTNDDKSCTLEIEFLRELTWLEVLNIVNIGKDNVGRANTGNWNTGDSNTGDRNTGYRNTGAFCTNNNPMVLLFDKETNIPVRDWENHKAYIIMQDYLEINIWVPEHKMTDDEKAKYPSYKTAEGYLKPIPPKEAWANMWNNLSDGYKQVFIDLPNFDKDKFKEITGISV